MKEQEDIRIIIERLPAVLPKDSTDDDSSISHSIKNQEVIEKSIRVSN